MDKPSRPILYAFYNHREFHKSLNALYKRGGNFQRACERVEAVVGRLGLGGDPFQGLSVTNHGESRIPHCIKYDLPGECRLVTVQHAGQCIFLFVGDHPATDLWLERHRGLVVVVSDKNQIETTYVSGDADTKPKVGGGQGRSSGPLFEQLPEETFEVLVSDIPRRVVRQIEGFDCSCSDGELWEVLAQVSDGERRRALFDVLALLRQDKTREATERAALFFGDATLLQEFPAELLPDIVDSDVIRRIRPETASYSEALKRFMRTARYRDWMLFMHPEQEAIAEEDFDGIAKLMGVSGSGKTCVVVQRAVRLARKYPRGRILVLTLNKALAKLISQLVESCANKEECTRIDIRPFFALCQTLLANVEPDAKRIYDEVTWKTNEHVDEVWQEYYRCETNNYDARVFQPVHDMLLARGWNPERYLREEVDWLRSALPPSLRSEYLDIKRQGRTVPLTAPFRQAVIAGTAGWEDKMQVVGVVDALGIAQALFRHINHLKPLYRCILVDEAQDFGNVELEIIRRLVAEGENDIFLSGDAAQAVTTKHESLKAINMAVPSSRSRKLLLNYRNSRDVLEAAFAVLEKNMTAETIDREDFDVLDPEYSSFSAAAPLLLQANSLGNELAYARSHAEDLIKDRLDGKACIAICGYTLYELQKFGRRVRIPVLDGSSSIDDGKVFLSDLEQTKGFEFDAVLILNCSMGILPDSTAPSEEMFRDLARLYVAMTRAKTNLILSWSDAISPFLTGLAEHFLTANWSEYMPEIPPALGVPKQLQAHRQFGKNRKTWSQMTGEEFLYSPMAVGLPAALIAKIRELVDGTGASRGRIRFRWKSIGSAAEDYRHVPVARPEWGPETGQLFTELIQRLDGNSKVGQPV